MNKILDKVLHGNRHIEIDIDQTNFLIIEQFGFRSKQNKEFQQSRTVNRTKLKYNKNRVTSTTIMNL